MESNRLCFSVMGGILTVILAAMCSQAADYPIRPVPFTNVQINDAFWGPRIETNRTVTVPYCFQKCEETGRIDNFAKAGGLMDGPFLGIFFNDSDVFKVIEGAAYSLSLHPDPKLDAYLDGLIAKIAAAQEDDGYLYTARTLNPENPPKGSGPERWSNLSSSHELYNIGHMYEAAVAHFLATGKRSLLDVALKSADLVDSVFGPGKRRDVPGHQEIEIGLVRLYRVTNDQRYLNLAKFFLDERGRPDGHTLYGPMLQDHEPVTEQKEAVGHAVRAGYMYSGMADVAALTNDQSFRNALDTIWQDVAGGKIYITGGIGSCRDSERFGAAFELPNLTAYNETCAAIANCFWNHRMFLLHGDAKYMDVFERTLYNGFLAGVSMSGDQFFYPNPLACDGAHPFNHGAMTRQPWFGCSCCPVNVVRFVASLGGYMYAVRDASVYVNLYAAGTATVEMGESSLTLVQETRYPWDGRVEIIVKPAVSSQFALNLRIPCWAQGSPMPGDLYRFLNPVEETVHLAVNGEEIPVALQDGYARIDRAWVAGDRVTLDLPMPVHRVTCVERVVDNAGRIALERGPIVYCLEAVDNHGLVRNIAIPDDAVIETAFQPDLLNGVVVMRGKGLAKNRAKDGKDETVESAEFTAVPYYAWCHREPGEMAVWIPRDAALTAPAPIPTIASSSTISASHSNPPDNQRALNDQIEPGSSGDQDAPRFTWWDHKGTVEWVQYTFSAPTRVAAAEVYWFDDTGTGGCRVPHSWRLLYRMGQDWVAVSNPSTYGVEKDAFNRVTFDPVETDGLRLVATLQDDFSGGILEWRVHPAE